MLAAPIFQKYVEERKSSDLSHEDEAKRGMRLLIYENFNGVSDQLFQIGEQLMDQIPLHVQSALQQRERLNEHGQLRKKVMAWKHSCARSSFLPCPLVDSSQANGSLHLIF